MWRRILAVGAAAAVAVALWLAVLFDFPSFHGGGPHLPALGPSRPSPSPSGLANPGPQPPGDASNPQAQAGPAGSTSLTGGGNRGDEVEDEPPNSSGGGLMAPTSTPAPAPGVLGQNVLPSAPALPTPSLPALPLPTPPVP